MQIDLNKVVKEKEAQGEGIEVMYVWEEGMVCTQQARNATLHCV